MNLKYRGYRETRCKPLLTLKNWESLIRLCQSKKACPVPEFDSLDVYKTKN